MPPKLESKRGLLLAVGAIEPQNGGLDPDLPRPSLDTPLHPIVAATFNKTALVDDADDQELARRGKQRRKLYKTLAILGEGSEGVVRLAQIVATGERCALKARKKRLDQLAAAPGTPLAVRRAAAAGLAPIINSHPHLPHCFDLFESKITFTRCGRYCGLLYRAM